MDKYRAYRENTKSNIKLMIGYLTDVLSISDRITITNNDYTLSKELYQKVIDFKNEVLYNGDVPF